jgi:hypothetical protein
VTQQRQHAAAQVLDRILDATQFNRVRNVARRTDDEQVAQVFVE